MPPVPDAVRVRGRGTAVWKTYCSRRCTRVRSSRVRRGAVIERGPGEFEEDLVGHGRRAGGEQSLLHRMSRPLPGRVWRPKCILGAGGGDGVECRLPRGGRTMEDRITLYASHCQFLHPGQRRGSMRRERGSGRNAPSPTSSQSRTGSSARRDGISGENVDVTVKYLSEAPPVEREGWDHIAEASLNVLQGPVVRTRVPGLVAPLLRGAARLAARGSANPPAGASGGRGRENGDARGSTSSRCGRHSGRS